MQNSIYFFINKSKIGIVSKISKKVFLAVIFNSYRKFGFHKMIFLFNYFFLITPLLQSNSTRPIQNFLILTMIYSRYIFLRKICWFSYLKINARRIISPILWKLMKIPPEWKFHQFGRCLLERNSGIELHQLDNRVRRIMTKVQLWLIPSLDGDHVCTGYGVF